MAKRFVDSDKWSDPWYRELSPKAKLFWDYILCRCDHAGIWKPDFGLASFCIGHQYGVDVLLEFGSRIVVLPNGRWFVPKFISFQYSSGLTDKSSIHRGVLKALHDNGIEYPINMESLTKGLPNPLLSLTEGLPNHYQMIKDKDKDKDKDTSLLVASMFEGLWNKYPKKIGKKEAERSYRTSVKTEKDLDLINKALEKYLIHAAGQDPKFIKHGSSWFNNWQDWVEYVEPVAPEEQKKIDADFKKAERLLRNVTEHSNAGQGLPGPSQVHGAV